MTSLLDSLALFITTLSSHMFLYQVSNDFSREVHKALFTQWENHVRINVYLIPIMGAAILIFC